MTEEQWATIVALVTAYAAECCGCNATLAVPEQVREMVERAEEALPEFDDKHDVVEYAETVFGQPAVG